MFCAGTTGRPESQASNGLRPALWGLGAAPEVAWGLQRSGQCTFVVLRYSPAGRVRLC